jgi:chromosome segregation ATPase
MLTLAGTFLCGNAKTIFSQTTADSTQTRADDEARRRQLIEALERAQDEVKASRKYIDALEAQVKSKQSIIEAQAKRQTLSDEAITSLQKEVEILKSVIAVQEKTIETDRNEIDYLKKELDKTNKKLKRSRSLNKYLIVGVAAAVLASIFK